MVIYFELESFYSLLSFITPFYSEKNHKEVDIMLGQVFTGMNLFICFCLIVEIFLYFIDAEYHLAFPYEAMAGMYGSIDTNTKQIENYDWSGKHKCYSHSSKIRVISKLRNFLTLFSQLNINYKNKSQRFYPQIAQYYSHELRKQTKQFELNITKTKTKTKRIGKHRNCSLLPLLKLNTLKAGLINFNMIKCDIRCVVSDIDRIYIVPIVVRILYNKLFEKQKRKVKSTISNRRNAILTYISTLETPEINAFLDILHHSFVRWYNDINNNDITMNKCSVFAPGFASQHQYITIIHLWQKCAPISMGKHLEKLCKYLTIIFKHSYKFFSGTNKYRNGRTFAQNEDEMCYRNYNVCLEILQLFIQYYISSSQMCQLLFVHVLYKSAK